MKLKILFLSALVALGACVQDTSKGGGGNFAGDLPYVFADFSDIPRPDRVTMDMKETRIYGRDNDWLGTITFKSPYDIEGMFDFYISEMPKFGWVEITTVRSDNSVMAYIRARRVAVIQIASNPFGGSRVAFTVSTAPPGVRAVGEDGAPSGRRARPAAPEATQAQSAPEEFGAAPAAGAPITAVEKLNTSDKSAPGALGLGEASNVNYQSGSRGVGRSI